MQFTATLLAALSVISAANAQAADFGAPDDVAPAAATPTAAAPAAAAPTDVATVDGATVDGYGNPAPTRTITAGTVIGVATPVTSASSTTTVYNFLGIPYAKAPTSSLRFQPPQTSVTFSAPLHATTYAPGCLQQTNVSTFADAPLVNFGATSEDCLYLNVYAPTDASATSLKPVMFYIYGGNLQLGAASLKPYNGSSFAGFQDVVVVTANYRHSIFGFSNSPKVAFGSQNSGYLDQRAALAWVQKNIAGFGGDPTKVTIQGESAGGYSVKQLLANPPSPLGYRAAVIESQGILLPGNSSAYYQNVSQHFGCTNQATQLSCLQAVPASQLLGYVNMQGFNFAPVNDNVTQSNDVRPNIQSKKFANVPFFLGTNADEGRVLAYGAGFDTGGNNSAATLPQAVNMVLGMILTPAQQQAVVNAYTPYYNQQGKSTYLAISRIITDFVFDCQSGFFLNYTISNGFPNTYRYYYNATFPNLNFFPNAGSYHSSEIPQVWGTYDLVNTLGAATATQISLSKFMQTAWANFFKTPANGPGWVKYTGGANTVAQIGGASNTTGVTLISPVVPDRFCAVFADYFNTNGY